MNVINFFNSLSKKLFSLNRSLTGQGNISTLREIKKYIPKLKLIKFKSGTRIFDWKIPLEWNVKKAYILHIKSKKKFANFNENNLHLVSYSIPQKKILDKKDLVKKVYSIKNKPNLIPYVTSYYKRDWGFCLSHNQLKKMPKGKYNVLIDSSLKSGHMIMGENYIKGKSKKEFFFSTNICHPSMANNELSGILMCTALSNYISKKYKKNKLSYRFVFLPETIGSLAYLSKKINYMKKNIIGGFVISCVGDDGEFSHIESPYADNLSDRILKLAFKNKKNTKTYSFLKRGSDERQYCSPKINLPICGFSRTKYHEYPEYHTSGDNLNFLSMHGMNKTYKMLTSIIDLIEEGLFPVSKNYGEPFLTKYGLYRTLAKESIKKDTKNLINFLAYSDGKTSSFDIALKCNLDLDETLKVLKILKNNKLVFIKD